MWKGRLRCGSYGAMLSARERTQAHQEMTRVVNRRKRECGGQVALDHSRTDGGVDIDKKTLGLT